MANNNHATPAPSRSASSLRSWLPRALMLGVIWGIAVFLWGTFGAWTRDQYSTGELKLAASRAASVNAWLNQAVQPLDRLAADKRLALGMELPAGVESLPVQRVLYEYAYLTGQSEVYIVDLVHQRVGHTAGATPLPAGAIARLSEMNGSSHMILGLGQRGGQMLLGRQVAAPLPNRLVVLVPVSLATLATGQPTYNLPPQRKLSLVVPHTVGWALWRDGEQGFQFDDLLQDAMKHRATSFINGTVLMVLAPLKGWPQVALGLESPNQITGTHLLPQLMVGAWALLMSLLVLWHASPVMQGKLKALTAPVTGPLGNLIRPLKDGVGGAMSTMSKLFASRGKEIPLAGGPGAFEKPDLMSADELMRRMRDGKRRPKSSGNVAKLAQKAPDKVKRGHGGIKSETTRDLKPMSWPVVPTMDIKPPEVPDARIDKDDIDAIVEDCLKKRRVKLLYQPIYRAGDNMPVMHEVYARLVRSDGVIITPDIFMPVATRNKLTLELDLVVLRKVINEHFGGNATPLTPLALNISSTSLDGIAYLQEMANQGPRVLQKISFEVSSQEMIRDPKALRLLKELQKHGGNLAVDYFGGGTAMLEASRAMGFNYVKMNCLRLMGTDAGKKEIITMCQHARGLGLPIILEMVGDAQALEFARRAGAEFLQGYALARPQDEMTTRQLTPDLDGVKNLAAPVL